MKKILILFTVFIFGISCENESTNETLDKNVLIENLKKSAIKYNNSNYLNSKNFNTTQNNSEYQELMNNSLILIRSYGLTDSEIIQDVGALNSEDVILGALAISGVEIKAANGIDLIDPIDNSSLFTGKERNLSIFKNSNEIQSDGFECLLQAVGITAIRDLLQSGINDMPKGAVRKLLKKVATKYLGAIGAAIAVYEFGDCMNYWKTTSHENK